MLTVMFALVTPACLKTQRHSKHKTLTVKWIMYKVILDAMWVCTVKPTHAWKLIETTTDTLELHSKETFKSSCIIKK